MILHKNNVFVKKNMISQNIINLLIKRMILQKNNKSVTKKWKGVISGKIKIFPLVCNKYLSSWTGLGRSGHVQITTFGPISRVSDSK